jgi:hypothetical protein
MSIHKFPIAIVFCCATFLVATPAYAGGCSIAKITNTINKLIRGVERAQDQVNTLLGETPKERKCEDRKISSAAKLEAKRVKFQNLPKIAGCFTGADDAAAPHCIKAFNKNGNFDIKLGKVQGKKCEEKNKIKKQLRAAGRVATLEAKIEKLTVKLATCGGSFFDDLF